MARSIIWFDDSPDVGTRECICSWCAEIIGDCNFNDHRDMPVRIWNKLGQEARFHAKCFDMSYLEKYKPIKMIMKEDDHIQYYIMDPENIKDIFTTS